MGSQNPGNRRSDEQLEAILFETATWTINGPNGQVLRTVSSLRQALDKAADFAASDSIVGAICRTQGDSILVFADQAEQLRKLCAGREAAVLREPLTDHRAMSQPQRE